LALGEALQFAGRFFIHRQFHSIGQVVTSRTASTNSMSSASHVGSVLISRSAASDTAGPPVDYPNCPAGKTSLVDRGAFSGRTAAPARLYRLEQKRGTRQDEQMAQAPIVRFEDPVAGQDRDDALQRVA
jgi:hypothetical protein